VYSSDADGKQLFEEMLDQGVKHANRMWPARAFCAARDAFREFSNI